MQSFDHYLVLDLEATCCNAESFPKHEMETIEIGAVMVAAHNLQPISEFQTFIKPVRHPKLTAFCTSLTSITQADADSAPSYAEAMDHFRSWMYQYPSFLFCSWGDYDRKQLEQDSAYHKSPYPVGAPHCNIKKAFTEKQGISKKPGMADALKLCGLPLEGTHHRGIDDARNMVRLLPWIFGERKIRGSQR